MECGSWECDSGAETHAFGLRVLSQFDVPGAGLGTGREIAAAPDLRIVAGVVDWHQTGEQTLGSYRRHGDWLLFEAPGVARYLWQPEWATITIEAEAGAKAADLSALLIATMLPAAVWMLGGLVLHAATAVLPGGTGAVALAGPSGSGKSRLVRALLDRGSLLVGDDTLRVHLEEAEISGSGLPGGTLQRAQKETGGDGPADERAFVPVPAIRQVCAAPLAAVLVLDADGPAQPERLRGTAALEALLQQLHRPRVPRLMGLLPDLLPRLAELARRVPVYRWSPQFDDAEDALRLVLAGEAGG